MEESRPQADSQRAEMHILDIIHPVFDDERADVFGGVCGYMEYLLVVEEMDVIGEVEGVNGWGNGGKDVTEGVIDCERD